MMADQIRPTDRNDHDDNVNCDEEEQMMTGLAEENDDDGWSHSQSFKLA